MNPEQLLDRFSTHLKNIIAKAMALATSLEQTAVSPLQLLVALYEEQGAVGAEILRKFKLNSDFLYRQIDQTKPKIALPARTATAVLPELNIFARKAMEKAMLLAYERSHRHVGTEHLLWGLIHCEDKQLNEILDYFKITKTQIDEQLENILQSTSNFPEVDEVSQLMSQIEDAIGNDSGIPLPKPPASSPSSKKVRASALEIFTVNLTDQRRQKNIDPVIGREKEIERVIHILSRRTKNNPVLVGEPGVGKTAIVEGLAKKISQGQVPAVLRGKKILALDLTLLIAGTIYRGEFEARLKQIIDEFSQAPDCILFIDELHNIMGAGSSQGAMDAANILKPALARGELRCIGATTIDEYKKHLAADPALERRFQAINIEEPTTAETRQILQGVKKYYENFHQLKITDEAVATAVELSERYLHDNFQPDKALDLLDEAGAAVRTKIRLSPLAEKREKLLDLFAEAQQQKAEAIANENFTRAWEIKKNLEALDKKLASLEKQLKKAPPLPLKKVLKKDIVHVLSNRLHVPEEALTSNQWEELETLAARLQKKIIGQEEVINKLVNTLRQAQIGLKKPQRPFASFLFAGPSGVGKTELAKILAQELFHDDKSLIKLDMSEFSESHSTAKLLGSPAGYIGYKERNRFLEKIRRRPYCVLLFDEIDKAHRDVAKLLLQILDEGELTDSGGKKTNFRHAIIILTTNIGAELFKTNGIGFGAEKNSQQIERDKNIISKLKEELTAALLSRLDSVLIFSPLSVETVKQIISKQVEDLNTQLNLSQKIKINLSADAISKLSKNAYNKEEGARNVERVLQNVIQDLLITVLKKEKRKSVYTLAAKADKFVLR